MSGLKTSLAAFALLGVLGASAEAQGVVPGGWSAQFGYQPLGSTNFIAGSDFGPGAGSFGFGGVGFGGFGSYPMGGAANGFGPSTSPSALAVPQTGFANGNFLGLSPGMPQTSVSADPLMGAISKSVRRSKRR
jgi:hypothetical protein